MGHWTQKVLSKKLILWGSEGCVRKVKGLGRTIGSHKIVKYNMGKIINKVVKTVYGVRYALDLSGGVLQKFYKCLPTAMYT